MTVQSLAVAAREQKRFHSSGWVRLPALQNKLDADPGMLIGKQGPSFWRRVDELYNEFSEWLNGKKFSANVEVGLLYVPAPQILDTRAPVDRSVRQQQNPVLLEDIFDTRLDRGSNVIADGSQGGFFLTCVGKYGVSIGSYETIRRAPKEDFIVAGIDLRDGMTRQLWGARVLQSGADFLPDCEANDTWTFTLFAGEHLVDGQAQSGTVLKSHVRYRLGKANRGISSVRASPAVPVIFH